MTSPDPVTVPTPMILVVDDDPVFRSLARDALANNGMPVIEAADGLEAAEFCRDTAPSLLVVDAVMPNMDGFALCRELRGQDATRHTPILMVTGLRDQEALERAYHAGATDFIAKPVAWETLTQRVRYNLRNATATAELRGGLVEPPPSLRPVPEIARLEPAAAADAMSILVADDDAVIRALMREALEDEGYAVTEAPDGLAAYTLCQHQIPDMIITDVMMPAMDGFELCRRLRQHSETAHVPILVATGLNDHGAVGTAYEAGATDFINKPLDWPVLKYRVRYMVRAARAFAELVVAKERAEAADREKSAFLANMSHELRTPLNAVIGFSQILQEQLLGPLSAKYAEYAKVIGDSGSHLLTIINDLLDLAKSEAQGIGLIEEDVAVADIVAFAAQMVERVARDGDIQFSAQVDDALPAFRADGKKLQQVLINLLVNAIKFTPRGGSVRLTAARDGGLLLRVADTGIGIPPDKIAVALSPFGQIDSALSRKNDGAGIGLPLTKRLVELHGGSLDIDSEPGVGTVVTARFPRERFILAPAVDAVAI